MVSKRVQCVSNVHVTYKSAQYFIKQKNVLKAKTRLLRVTFIKKVIKFSNSIIAQMIKVALKEI